MIDRRHRINFRLNDWHKERFELLIQSKHGPRWVRNWTDLCIHALMRAWEEAGKPEPDPLEVSDKLPAKRQTDLFSIKRRPRPAATSAPTRSTTTKRKKR